MSEIIPFDPSRFPDKFSVELDGETYVFLAVWNHRTQSYAVSIFDADRTPIRTGVKVRTGRPLFSSVVDERMPPGDFLAVALDGQGDPRRGELGERVKIHYFPGPPNG